MFINQVSPDDLTSAGTCNQDWRDLYRAAVFEKDRAKAAELILDAERVITLRVRSLFHTQSGASDERQALHAALHALHLLRHYSRPTEFIR
jgi:hypothetical protein